MSDKGDMLNVQDRGACRTGLNTTDLEKRASMLVETQLYPDWCPIASHDV